MATMNRLPLDYETVYMFPDSPSSSSSQSASSSPSAYNSKWIPLQQVSLDNTTMRDLSSVPSGNNSQPTTSSHDVVPVQNIVAHEEVANILYSPLALGVGCFIESFLEAGACLSLVLRTGVHAYILLYWAPVTVFLTGILAIKTYRNTSINKGMLLMMAGVVMFTTSYLGLSFGNLDYEEKELRSIKRTLMLLHARNVVLLILSFLTCITGGKVLYHAMEKFLRAEAKPAEGSMEMGAMLPEYPH